MEKLEQEETEKKEREEKNKANVRSLITLSVEEKFLKGFRRCKKEGA